MNEAVFFRLLSESVEDKPTVLEAQLAALNKGFKLENTSTIADSAFAQIPSSPFAYWTPQSLFDLYSTFKRLESDLISARLGATTNDDFRFLNLYWEVKPESLVSYWVPFAKGGSFSKYFYDICLVLDWENNGERLREFSIQRGDSPSRNIRSEDKYLRPGLTWPRRTSSGISFRAMPAGCIFADKGPAMFVSKDDTNYLLGLLALTNSTLFESLVKLQLGAADAAARSYEVGIIQSTPIPDQTDEYIAPFAHRAHDLQREKSIPDETTHVFQLPALIAVGADSLAEASTLLEAQANARHAELDQIQAQIDDIVFDLYGLAESDRDIVHREMGTTVTPLLEDEDVVIENDEDDSSDEDSAAALTDLPTHAQNLLMWCVGVVFGRWDVRKALDPALLPALPEPFDPLPRCASGALMNSDGLPATPEDVPANYPLPIAWNGVLLDDPAQDNNPQSLDIVARVRGVLTLLWADRADAIEHELCGALGLHDLRDYFRNPAKGFFNFHIKRYSKSRRKAPIYWLLQSPRRNCAVWLYYPRLVENTLYVAENTVYDLMKREQARVEEFKGSLDSVTGAERRRRERDLDAQSRLADEIGAFQGVIKTLANQRLPPDHNDGVLISIAPLHDLVPWKEAAATWQKLLRGEYAWSGMSAQMKQRSLLKS